jgi:hypothetical protein
MNALCYRTLFALRSDREREREREREDLMQEGFRQRDGKQGTEVGGTSRVWAALPQPLVLAGVSALHALYSPPHYRTELCIHSSVARAGLAQRSTRRHPRARTRQ